MKVLDNPKTKRISLKGLCAHFDVPYKTVHFRLSKGYSIRDALMLPVNAPRAVVNSTHGMHDTPEYTAWVSMHQRCKSHPHYVKLGIMVCLQWSSFKIFYADMGARPEGMSLDRYPDGTGNYEPGNCRWATPRQQSQNTSRNVFMEVNGERFCVAEGARRAGISEHALAARLERGMSPEQAITARRWERMP